MPGSAGSKYFTGSSGPEAVPIEIDEAYVASRIPPRRLWARKGDHGRVLVVGGSRLFHGAPVLSSLAAYRAGSDLVYTAVPRRLELAVRAASPSLIVIPLPDLKLTEGSAKRLLKWMPEVSAALVGPGLGADASRGCTYLVRELCAKGIPLVLDGDALRKEVVSEARGAAIVLTPHPGEFKRITGVPPGDEVGQRLELVREWADRLGVTVLLKGHVDVISDGKRVAVDRHGSPALTVGGTGDVLAGVVVSMLGRGLGSFDAACVGAYVIGRCGEILSAKLGFHIVPTDLVAAIPEVLRAFDKTAE
jgi:ADP-dependent NAD(P)H-hydrate dehydratase